MTQVWKYNEGEVLAIGFGHGGEVKRAKICPNNRTIVSVGDDGSILRWKLPRVQKKQRVERVALLSHAHFNNRALLEALIFQGSGLLLIFFQTLFANHKYFQRFFFELNSFSLLPLFFFSLLYYLIYQIKTRPIKESE